MTISLGPEPWPKKVAIQGCAWVKPAPGKYAKAYASRINDLFGGQRSVGELLFLTEQTELGVCIDAAFDHSTLSALSIMRVVEVVSIKRAGARRPPDVEPSTKVQMGDELMLRATPHVLSTVAVSKGGKVVLAPKPTREKLSRQVKAERCALLGAAEALQSKVLPLVRSRLGFIREQKRMRAAAMRMQCVWRGHKERRAMWPKVEGQRARKKAAKLRSRKLLAGLIHQQHLAPVYVETKLEPEAEASRAASAKEARQRWREANPVVAGWYAEQSALAKAHSGALNRAIAAAPESTKKKLSARRLARSPLNLLLSSGVELTAAVDQSGNNVTVKGLMLPKTLSVSKVTVNGKIVVAKRPGALDPTKVLNGDSITLKGLPHHIASVAEVKSNRLTLMPIKTRKEAASVEGDGTASGLQRERSMLLAAADRLARRLQRVVRQRLELRAHHRRSHAALVIQIGWACYYAEHVQPRVAIERMAEAEAAANAKAAKAAAERAKRAEAEAQVAAEAKAAAEAQAAAEARAAEEQSQEEEATDEVGQVVAVMSVEAVDEAEAQAWLEAEAKTADVTDQSDAAAESGGAGHEEEALPGTEQAAEQEPVASDASADVNSTKEVKEMEECEQQEVQQTPDDDGWYVDCFLARRRLKAEFTKSGKAEWEYLVRWIGKGPEEDRWVPESALDPALIEAELSSAAQEAAAAPDADKPGADAAAEQQEQKAQKPDDDGWYVDCFLARRRLKAEFTKSGKAEWEYLVRWIGKGPEEDRWVPESALDPALIEAELGATDFQPAKTQAEAALEAAAAASVADELARYTAAAAAEPPQPPPAVLAANDDDEAESRIPNSSASETDGSQREPSPTGSEESPLASPASSSSEQSAAEDGKKGKLMPGAWLGTDSKTTLANGALALLKQAKAAKAAAVSDSEDDDEYEEEADANAWMAEALGRQPALAM